MVVVIKSLQGVPFNPQQTSQAQETILLSSLQRNGTKELSLNNKKRRAGKNCGGKNCPFEGARSSPIFWEQSYCSYCPPPPPPPPPHLLFIGGRGGGKTVGFYCQKWKSQKNKMWVYRPPTWIDRKSSTVWHGSIHSIIGLTTVAFWEFCYTPQSC